ncbi:MAG: FadR family transcriptional regulator [Methylobacteriaceae bacterium]|nr:FadR family transcriptional regulator [Methylobacteriaceae bacterium]
MRTSLTDEVTANISAAISAGQFPPGTKLPTGQQLAQEYGVSLTVIRESVSRLLADGMVTSRQGSGIYVADISFRRPFRIDDPTLIEPIYIFELRAAMEVTAAGLAALRHTDAEFARIEEAQSLIGEAFARGEEAVDEDLQFHCAVADATGNPLFKQFMEFLRPHIQGAISASRVKGGAQGVAIVLEEHSYVIDAIRRRDQVAAEAAMGAHMEKCKARCA